MPVLYILAGPNGAGKTSFYNTAIERGLIHSELPFVNVDNIAKQLGGYSDYHYQEASDRYRVIEKNY